MWTAKPGNIAADVKGESLVNIDCTDFVVVIAQLALSQAFPHSASTANITMQARH